MLLFDFMFAPLISKLRARLPSVKVFIVTSGGSLHCQHLQFAVLAWSCTFAACPQAHCFSCNTYSARTLDAQGNLALAP